MRSGDENARADVESGVYEKHYAIQPGDVVLDLGAHIGFFTELASSKVGASGRVIAFEPHPDNFRLLQEHLEYSSNAVLIHAAAGNRTRLVKLYHNPGNTGGSSLFKNDQHSHHFTVPCLRPSQFIGNRHVRFVKCDTEGSELEILLDLLPVLTPPVDIAFETHNADLYEACRALLIGHGFQFEPMTAHVGVCYAWR